MLEDNEWRVRIQAASALIQLGKTSSELIDILVNFLKHDESGVKVQVALILAQLSKTTSQKLIDKYLFKAVTKPDPDPYVRVQAASALVQLGKVPVIVIGELVAALTNIDSMIREQAAWALGNLKGASSRIIAKLNNALEGGYSGVRAQAARALANLKQVSPAVINTLIMEFRKDSEVDAVSLLVQLGQEFPAIVTTTLIQALESGSAQISHTHIAYILVQLGEKSTEITYALFHSLMDEEEYHNVRAQAASALMQLVKPLPEDLITKLTKALEGPNQFRTQAAYVLGNLKQASPTVVTLLLQALENSDSRVRVEAACVLVQLGKTSPEVIAALIKVLEDNSSYYSYKNRRQAAYALENSKQALPNVIVSLLKMLEDNEWRVRKQAASALGSLLGKALYEEIEHVFDLYVAQTNFSNARNPTNNWGVFITQEIAKYTFTFFKGQILKSVGCVSKGCYVVQQEIEKEKNTNRNFC